MEDILIGGKCPVCGYDKMLHRLGKDCYEFDGCPKCGFGYGFDPKKDDYKDLKFEIGEEAWLKEGKTFLFNFIKDSDEQKKIKKSNKITLRKIIFNFIEEHELVKTYNFPAPTVFNYIVKGYSYGVEYLETNPIIFNSKKK